MAQTTVAINLEAKTKGTESVKSLKAQIKEATQEALALSQKFGEFSPEALKAAQRVAQLKDEMGDFQQRVQALNPDKFDAIGKVVGGVASGFSAAQGAMALFGAESEDVEKAMLKVQGAMAFAQGIQGVLDARNQFVALGKSAVASFRAMSAASKALMIGGIGLLITGITLLIENFDNIKESLGLVESEVSKMNKAMNDAAAQTKIQAADLNYYNSVVQDTSKSEGERQYALEQLKKAGIDTDDVNLANANSLQELNTRVKDNIVLIAQRARVEASAQILQEKTKKLIEMESQSLDEQITLWDRFVVTAAGAATMGLVQMDVQDRVIDRMNKQKKSVDEAIKINEKERESAIKLEGQALTTHKKIESTLKLRTEAEKKASQASKQSIDLEQEALERRAQMAALDQSTLEKAIEAADLAFLVRVKQLKKEGYTEIEIGKMRDAALEKIRHDFAEKERAKLEKDAKEREDFVKQKNDSLLKANDTYYKAVENKLIQSGANQAAFDALEIERLEANIEAQKALFGENSAEVIAAENELVKKKKDIYDKDVKAKEESEKAKQEAQMATVNEAANAISALGGLLKEGSDAAKAAALLDIAIKTGVGFAQGLDIAQKGAAGTGPAAPYAFPIFYAQQIAAVLGAVSRAKSILKGGSGGGGSTGGGGGGIPPAAPVMTPITGGTLPDEQQFGGMGRVYVLEGDITKTQTRVRRLRNTSVV